MKRSLPILIALVLLFSTVGWSADFWKGFKAYQKKDYATALREFKPLSEQGHATAPYNLSFIVRQRKRCSPEHGLRAYVAQRCCITRTRDSGRR